MISYLSSFALTFLKFPAFFIFPTNALKSEALPAEHKEPFWPLDIEARIAVAQLQHAPNNKQQEYGSSSPRTYATRKILSLPI